VTPSATLVIPAYLEAARLPRTLPKVVAAFRDLSVEVLVVDDGSPDATAQVAGQLLAELGDRGRVVRLPRHLGKGAAVRRGLAEARGQQVLVTDGDLPYGLEALMRAQALLDAGQCDVVAGERRAVAGRFWRRIASVVFRFLVRLLFDLPVADSQCGLKAMTRAVALELARDSAIDGFAFDVELLARAQARGWRVSVLKVELEADHRSRRGLLWRAPRTLFDLLCIGAALGPRPVRLHVELACAAALLALCAGLTVPLLALGFHADDLSHLGNAARFGVWDFVASPATLRAVSHAHLTPLLGLSLKLDWLMFGLSPTGYTVHSALWWWAAGLAAYWLLRELGTAPLGALTGAACVMLAPATVSVASWFSARQYLFGLAFTLLSLTAFCRWARTGQRAVLALGFLACALALFSKELYFAPLLLAGALLPGSWRRRAAVLVGCAVLALGYLAARATVLGQVVGGYRGGDYDAVAALLSLGQSAGRFAALLVAGSRGGRFWPATLVGAGLVFAFLRLAWKASGLRGVGQALLLAAASLAAVVPILDYPLIRFADWKSPLDDRLALAFSAAVLLGLVCQLFSRAGPAQPPCRVVARQLAAAAIAGVLLVSATVTLGGLPNERLTGAQWHYLRAHLRDEVFVVGVAAADIESLARLAAEPGERRMRAIDSSTPVDAKPENVVLVTAGEPVRRAGSREEVAQWVARWGEVR
jgi:hypothetical protein